MATKRRPVYTAATVAALLAVSVTACGTTDDNAGTDVGPTTSIVVDKDGLKLPEGLPTSLDGLKAGDLEKLKDAYQNGAWKDWEKEKWLREASDFINPIIKDLWDADRLRDADKNPVEEPEVPEDDGTTDPVPAPVQAKQLTTPYYNSSPATGKLVFDVPEGQAVCSATVVADPANPGKSNMLWTAGHCVHAGAAGGWFRNVAFVPSYNNQGLTGAALETATRDEIAPYGVWWAKKASTSEQWIAGGGESDSSAFPYDYAVLKVTNPDSQKSLEETVGASLPVWFDAPAATGIPSMGVRGYPAAAPFDGEQQFSCLDAPTRLSMAPEAPTMFRVGCTMTAGSSGGGWYATNPDGDVSLVSNTSIGPAKGSGWLAGPHLGADAKALYEGVSKAP